MPMRWATSRETAAARGDPATAKQAVSGHVGFLLARAHQRVRVAMLEAIAGDGLHLGQVAVLGALSAAGSLSQRALCEVTGIEKSSMVLVIDALEAAGSVRRSPHETDRRSHAVELTASGTRLLRGIGPRLQAAEARVMSALTPGQGRSLLTLLQRLVDAP